MPNTTQSNQLIVDLHISSDEFLLHYQGNVKQVSCVSRDGRQVRFPTNILQPFVEHTGIHGTFVIYFDKFYKFEKIERIS
jgi:hypothetical protein